MFQKYFSLNLCIIPYIIEFVLGVGTHMVLKKMENWNETLVILCKTECILW